MSSDMNHGYSCGRSWANSLNFVESRQKAGVFFEQSTNDASTGCSSPHRSAGTGRAGVAQAARPQPERSQIWASAGKFVTKTRAAASRRARERGVISGSSIGSSSQEELGAARVVPTEFSSRRETKGDNQ